MSKKKRGEKEDESEPGTFKYAWKTGMKNPIEFYHARLDYLKRKRKNSRNNQNGILKKLKEWWNKKR